MRRKVMLVCGLMTMMVFSVGTTARAGTVMSEMDINLSGVIEAEAGFSSDYDNNDTGDIVLATMAFAVDTRLNAWCSGHALFLWEEDVTEPVDVDEGFITVGGKDAYPFYFSAGKLYVPFGVYETSMVSDPLTLEIGETRESALQVGVGYNGFYGAVYAFNGDVQDTTGNSDDTIETFGVNTGYFFENNEISVDLGIDWISNLMDSDGLEGVFQDARDVFADANPNGSFDLESYVAGIGVHAIVNVASFSLIGEYIIVTDDVDYVTDDGAGLITTISSDKPMALHLEGVFTFEAMGREMSLAATWQSTDNLGGFLPEIRYGAAAGIALAGNLGLAIEYVHDEDYSVNDGGTDESADTFTLQLALAF